MLTSSTESQPSDNPSPYPDPSSIDRRGLIGVGELATPRWARSPETHVRTPSLPQDFGAHVGSTWSKGESGHGLGVGITPDIPSEATPDLGLPDIAHLIDSFGDFVFDTTPAVSTPAVSTPAVSTPAMPTPQPINNLEPSRSYIDTLPASPGSARARIAARRQERLSRQFLVNPERPHIQDRSTSKTTPPSSADSSKHTPESLKTESSRMESSKAESSRTPESSTKKTPQSPNILKHFAPRDFSHLPPSPSTASINQFLRGSGSVKNLQTSYAPSSPVNTRTTSLQRSDSSKRIPRSAWAPDADAMRKLDGLGTSKSRSRPGTPVRASLPAPSKQSFGDGRDSPLNVWVDVAPAIVKGSDAPTSATPGLARPDTARRASASSDVSSVQSEGFLSALSGESFDKEKIVPPVPPIPKGYMSMRGLSAAAAPTFVPLRDETSPPVAPEKPTIYKKWSFPSVLNLKLHTQRDSSPETQSADRSPQTPWSEVEITSPVESATRPPESATRPLESATRPLESTSTTPVGVKPTAKRMTPSSIPFFRRVSTSSAKDIPEPVTQRTPSGSARKSVLGMHLPSMLRGSSSKRGLAQQLNEPIVETKSDEMSGWGSRRRGKVGYDLIELTADNVCNG